MLLVEFAAVGRELCGSCTRSGGKSLAAVTTYRGATGTIVARLVEDYINVLGHLPPAFEFSPPATDIVSVYAGRRWGRVHGAATGVS